MAYERVNGAWPEGTNNGYSIKPTAQEAITAAKLLYRHIFKKPFRGKVKLTSGNRYSYIRYGTMYVNPNFRGTGGWHELVHLLSHSFASRLHPGAAGHGYQHAFLEREMIDHVVKSGWLEGKLIRKTTPKPKPDAKLLRYQRTLAKIKAWQRREKRAKTALRKLRTTQRYYEKMLAAVPVAAEQQPDSYHQS